MAWWDGWIDALLALSLPRALVIFAALGVPPLMWEMWYNHHRGNFHRWPMILPLVIPPAFLAAAALLLTTDAEWARWAFAAAAALLVLMGILGLFFHVQGIARQTGGWNLDNIMVGPPMMAPLGFSALGVLGLLALPFWSA